MIQSSPPLLFIPGLFGCMSSEIVPRTGTWQFSFAKHIYIPFLDLLNQKGMDSANKVFILYYDWRKSTPYNVKTYLNPLLDKIARLTGRNEVNIIAHGTGGFLARYYLQHQPVHYPVKHLFMVGTPNAGMASAFSYLTGGELNISCGCVLDFISLYLRMHLYKTLPLNAPLPDYLLKIFPALGECLPFDHYGDYLFYLYNSQHHYGPYQTMAETNTFLDQLNKTYRPYPASTQVHLIAGEGYQTIETFEIMPICTSNLWIDGKVLDCIYTPEGDGATLMRSVFATDGIQHVVHSDYESLLVDAAPIYLPHIL